MKSGLVTILGRPNVGKSTLINYVIGSKISIATPKPQTTRFRVLGVKHMKDAQIIFADTPGFHLAKSALNKYMVNLAVSSLEGADLVYLLVEVGDYLGEEYPELFKILKKQKAPVFLVINKTDKYGSEQIQQTEEEFTNVFKFNEVVGISALTGKNVQNLIDKTIEYLPEGPEYFPEGQVTDLTLELRIAEIIREKIIILLQEELPYTTAVNIEEIKERENGVLYVNAVIYVSRESQKGILIGKKGTMIKKIGSFARFEIEQALKKQVYLELTVRVEEDWPKLENKLKKFGYVVPK